MGLFTRLGEERRRRKLEEVTRALEELKRENVVHADTLKPKHTASPLQKVPSLHTGRDLLFIGILILCIVALIIISFYYKGQSSSFKAKYEEKAETLKELERELEEKLVDLNETKYQLQFKEEVEEELSGRSKDLEDEITRLEDDIKKLQDEMNAKKEELANLTKITDDQRREIKKWKECIEDEYDGNLTKCD